MDQEKKPKSTVKKGETKTKKASSAKKASTTKTSATNKTSVVKASKETKNAKNADSTKIKKDNSSKKTTNSKVNKSNEVAVKNTTMKKTTKNNTGKMSSSATKKKSDEKVPKKVEEKKEVKKKIIEEVIIDNIDEKKVIKPEEKKDEIKEVKKEIPVSNYIIVIIVLACVIIVAFLSYQFYNKYLDKLYNEGYFIHEKVNINKITIDDLASTIAKPRAFILFNYRGEKDTYELEKELVQIIKDYKLENAFYYVDLTDVSISNDCDYVCKINSILESNKFKQIPAIAYYQSGTLIDIAQREDKKVLEAADFVKVLDMYEIKK